MLNSFPIVGWVISFFCAVSLSVPFWVVWTWCGIGSRYFGDYIPAQFASIPFWDCVGLFIVLIMVGGIIRYLSLAVVSIKQPNQTGETKKDEDKT